MLFCFLFSKKKYLWLNSGCLILWRISANKIIGARQLLWHTSFKRIPTLTTVRKGGENQNAPQNKYNNKNLIIKGASSICSQANIAGGKNLFEKNIGNLMWLDRIHVGIFCFFSAEGYCYVGLPYLKMISSLKLLNKKTD